MSPVSIEEKIVSFADLFYSKNPSDLKYEKNVAEIKNGLVKFGEFKLRTFDKWLMEMGR